MKGKISLLFFSLIFCFTVQTATAAPPSQSSKDFPYTLDRKDKMLKLCLSYNYGKSGVVSPLEMKDFSRLKEEINLEPPFDNSILMMKFIDANWG